MRQKLIIKAKFGNFDKISLGKIVRFFSFGFFIFTFLGMSSIQAKPIVIGSKNFTESIVLGETMAQLIEARTDLNVIRKLNMGGTVVNFEALKNGEIDLYPEYTGTGLVNLLKKPAINDPEKVFEIVKKEFKQNFDLIWLPQFGLNNTYAIAVRNDDPRVEGITSISDLAKVSGQLKLGAELEFLDRPDGYQNLAREYGLKFKKENISNLDAGLMYQAIEQGQVDVISALATDGRNKSFNLRILEDDRFFFPPYYAAPLVREETIQEHPELRTVLEELSGKLDDKTITAMNFQVDAEGKTPADVSREFLVKSGLVKGKYAQTSSSQKGFLHYFWSEKDYLFTLFWQHLYLTLFGLFIALIIGVPSGIILTRKPEIANYVFGVVNTIQTIPSLALLGFLIPLLGIGQTPAIIALSLYALLPVVRNTYVGIQEVNPILKDAVRGIGLTDMQILRTVEIPLALPTMLAGIRIATVLLVGTATLTSLVGAGGFGEPIFRGIASVQTNTILLGTIPTALMAILLDRILHWIESKVSN